MLASQRGCSDAAIAALENLSRTDAAAMSDLAAAYYVRAQREDRPSDLLRAFDAAEHALAASPRSPAARFNYALIEEALGLTEDAIRRGPTSSRSTTPNGRRKRASISTACSANRLMMPETRWARIRAQLPSAPIPVIARLITPLQKTAEQYLEDDCWRGGPQRRTSNSCVKRRRSPARSRKSPATGSRSTSLNRSNDRRKQCSQRSSCSLRPAARIASIQYTKGSL